MSRATPTRTLPRWAWWLGFGMVASAAVAATVYAYFRYIEILGRVPQLDKVAHFFTAGLLAFFLDGALARRNVRTIPLAAILVLVPSGLEETAQLFARTMRTPSFADYAADIAGVIVLVWLSRRTFV